MTHRVLTAGGGCALLGVAALALTPGTLPSHGSLAQAGADVPIWGFIAVALVLLAGLVLLLLGSRRRKDRDDEVRPAAGVGRRVAEERAEGADAAEMPREEDPRD